MKKTFILTFALLLAFVVSHAQTEKGTQTVGLNIQFNQSNANGGVADINGTLINETVKSNAITIGPQYSYFISDKLDLGGSFSYTGNSRTDPSNGAFSSEKQTNKSYGAMVFLRKYLMFADKFGVRAGPVFGYTHTNNSLVYTPAGNGYNDMYGKENSYTLGLTGELVYYPSKHLGFSATLANLGYNHAHTDNGGEGTQTSNEFYLNLINSGLSLSVFYSFGGK